MKRLLANTLLRFARRNTPRRASRQRPTSSRSVKYASVSSLKILLTNKARHPAMRTRDSTP
jgi:hypothetical protein